MIKILCMSLLCISTLCSAAKGERFAAEHQTLIAPESGLEIIQLTRHDADDSHLYFTSNGFVAAEQGLVFTSRRSGKWNLYYMNLRDYSFVQLTDAPSISGTGAVISLSRMEVFFKSSRQIRAVHLHTLQERDVVDLPEKYDVSTLTISADGQTLAMGLSEQIPLTSKTNKLYSEFQERFDKRPWSMLFVGQADGTGWQTLARQQKWISHTLLNPRDPDEILYCHEGDWKQVEQRMWLIQRNGSQQRKLREEAVPEIVIGHEFWFDDGIHVGYQVSQPGQARHFGIANTQSGEFREYPLAYRDGHLHANADASLLVGDGSEKEPYLNLYTWQGESYQATQLFRHGSSFSQQHWHPHPRFSPDGQTIVFSSSRDGNGNLYLLHLPATNAKQHLGSK